MAGEKRKDEQRKKEKNARKRRGHQREQGGANEWTTGHDHGRESCPRLWVQNEENNSPRRESTEDDSYVHWEDAADCERVSCRWFNYEDPVSEQLADILIGDSINRAVPLPIENMTMTGYVHPTLRSQQLNPVALPLLSGNGGTGMRIRTLITRTLAAIAPVVTAVEAAAASGRQGG
ncbi:hypothetical protein PV326_008916 [Microctonus aethiopoides]|nr:hypothetical protein PV326_008916 [Microctonus aethiopoides]